MTAMEILKQLATAGTAQNRKVYARHGVSREMFGVSYKVLGELQRQIKVNHPVAIDLWSTCNHDAMVLACKVADPAQMTLKDLNAWVCELDPVLAGAFIGLVVKTPHAFKKANQWIDAEAELTAAAGWGVLGALAYGAYRADYTPFLLRIETEIHQAKNYVRQAMNTTLISIGTVNADLHQQAMEVALRVGKVDVDHGETGCKTPDAASYMAKAWAHKNRKSTAKKKKQGAA